VLKLYTVFKLILELVEAYKKHQLKKQILKEINVERVQSFEQIKKDTEHLTREQLVDKLRTLREQRQQRM
jgi:hypothetical protein